MKCYRLMKAEHISKNVKITDDDGDGSVRY